MVRRLPAILPLVDAYNLGSLKFLLPAGAYDLDRLDGEVCLRFSAGGEPFTGMGGSEAEQTNPGEVVYGDERGVLTRHWNHRDAARSCIAEGTSRAVVLFEAAGEDVATATLRAAQSAVASTSAWCRAPLRGSAAHRLVGPRVTLRGVARLTPPAPPDGDVTRSLLDSAPTNRLRGVTRSAMRGGDKG